MNPKHSEVAMEYIDNADIEASQLSKPSIREKVTLIWEREQAS
jgi:hypothetical protein